MRKQFQNRPKTRRSHGDSEHDARLSMRCKDATRSAFLKAGGSEWGRQVIEKACSYCKSVYAEQTASKVYAPGWVDPRVLYRREEETKQHRPERGLKRK